MEAFTLLIIVAFILTVVGFVKPAWPLVHVAVLLVCVALMIGRKL